MPSAMKPGLAKRTFRKDRAGILVFFIAAVFPAYVVGESLFEHQRRSELLSHGVRSDAVVARQWKPGSKAACRTQFNFLVAGKGVQADVPGCAEDQRPGRHIEIAFDVDNPEQAIPVSQGAWDAGDKIGVFFFGLVFLLELALLFVFIRPTLSALMKRKQRG